MENEKRGAHRLLPVPDAKRTRGGWYVRCNPGGRNPDGAARCRENLSTRAYARQPFVAKQKLHVTSARLEKGRCARNSKSPRCESGIFFRTYVSYLIRNDAAGNRSRHPVTSRPSGSQHTRIFCNFIVRVMMRNVVISRSVQICVQIRMHGATRKYCFFPSHIRAGWVTMSLGILIFGGNFLRDILSR